MKLKTILASWLVCALTACGGGGSGISTQAPPEPERITISGFVSDDPVAGASVKLSSLDGDRPLGTAVSGSDGAFSITTGKADLGTGYRLESSGGTMNGQPFADILKAIYPAAKATGSSNLTLITTALVGTANSTTAFNGTLLQKHESILQDALKRGLLGLDYAAVEPAGRLMESLRQTSLVRGVANAVAALSETLDAFKASQSCVAGGTCRATAWVSTGQPTSLQVGPAEISWTDGALNQCNLVASYDDATQTLTAHLETNLDSLERPLCKVNGLVRLSLPDILASEAPDECLPSGDTAKPATHCVTVGSGIRPDFEVIAKSSENGSYASHRHPYRSVDLAINEIGPTSSISRSYSAVLYSSESPKVNTTGSAKDQWVGKTAVIFIHGFSPGFGGDTATWGNFPQLVSNDTSKVVLNFQWKTDTSFVRASKNLAKAVDYASLSTGGRKVHIIAHSFGGVLARTFLQNLSRDPSVSAASKLVATLVTAGTPHSGIASESSGRAVVDSQSPQRFASTRLPQGWDSTLPDTLCGQISCFEAGLSASVADWALRAMDPVNQDSPGYIPAMLADFQQFPLPAGLQILTLIGAPSISDGFLSGDGLVTYRGQGFRPNIIDTPLLSNETVKVSFATVTERVLGLPAQLPAYPGSTNSLASRSQYSLGGFGNYVAGYRHIKSRLLVAGLQVLRATAYDSPHAEVYLDPSSCDTSANCPHDTWILTRDFQANNPAGCAAPFVENNNLCVASAGPIAVVQSASCSAPVVGSVMICTVTGNNLPADTSMTATNCSPSNMAIASGGTVSIRQFSCTPKTLNLPVSITYKIPGIIGTPIAIPVVLAGMYATFYDTFDGDTLDPTKWNFHPNPTYGGSYAIIGSEVTFNKSWADTLNKVTFTGSKIVIEARIAGKDRLRDTTFYLYDVANSSNLISAHDTNYNGWGLTIQTTGAFGSINETNNLSFSSYKVIRLTIDGNQISLERGDSSGVMTEGIQRTMSTSIVGKSFYLLIGTGAPDYTPGSFDWISVTTY